MDAEDETADGRIFRHYQFMHTLGQGSFGKVKLAVNTVSNEKVAIKIVDKATIADVEDVERVYRETFILTTLKHKNIIKLLEVFDTQTCVMLAMEYAGGGELQTFLESRRRLPEMETCRIFHQIVSGVEYCHRAKIIHRDLKLENILLDEEGIVKIADFGLSNTIKFGQKMNTNCGTPSYTSPEQIKGQDYVGSATDIWAMGVILFCLLCGFLPFEAASVAQLYYKIKHRLYKVGTFVSKEAMDLIDRCLTVDPMARCTLAEIRNHPWFLMEYTKLSEKMNEMPEVTQELVDQAHEQCLEHGHEFIARMKEKEAEEAREEARAKLKAYSMSKASLNLEKKSKKVLNPTVSRQPSVRALKKGASGEVMSPKKASPGLSGVSPSARDILQAAGSPRPIKFCPAVSIEDEELGRQGNGVRLPPLPDSPVTAKHVVFAGQPLARPSPPLDLHKEEKLFPPNFERSPSSSPLSLISREKSIVLDKPVTAALAKPSKTARPAANNVNQPKQKPGAKTVRDTK